MEKNCVMMELRLMKRNKYMKKWMLFFGVVILFTACNKEVSDEITDPSTINVIYEVIKNTDDYSNDFEYIRAKVFSDEYIMHAVIKNGGITFNGTELPYNEQTSTYYIEKKIVNDSLYTFEMTLSDGEKIVSSVRTPETMFGSISTYPVKYDITQSLTIQWSDTIENGKVSVMLLGKPFSENADVVLYETIVDDHGECIITTYDLPSQYLSTQLESASFRLGRIIDGVKSEAFNTEDIYVQYSFGRSLEIIEN